MDNRPIGVFDSGLGGLTVWKQLRCELPNESLYYFGDGANCPYGGKTRAEVVGYVESAVKVLLENDIKMLVVACNAATAFAIDHLRQHYDMPIVGMEPAVKPAALSTKSRVIGIVATAATLSGELFQQTARKHSDQIEILTAVGEGFVEIVEDNMENTPLAVDVVRRVIEPMIEKGADKIVLGCTHYPFLEDAIRIVIADRDVELIDPAPAIERRVAQLLDHHNIKASESNVAEYRFFTAADEAYREKIISKSQKIINSTTVCSNR